MVWGAAVFRWARSVAALAAAVTLWSCGAAPGTVADTGHAGRDAAERADALVVFLHGYGSNGSDFDDMAAALAPRLPTAAFVFPNAPTPIDTGTDRPGYSWFDLAGGSADASRETARAWVTAEIERVRAILGVDAGRVVVVGFSQGGGVAVNVASCAPDLVRAGVAMGGLVDTACAAGLDRADIALVHMAGDPRVSVTWMREAEAMLVDKGFAPEVHVFPGATHWLSPRAQDTALDAVAAALAPNADR